LLTEDGKHRVDGDEIKRRGVEIEEMYGLR
jgi:hypothetical protein